jgi:mannitol/fructose-specific phosphotransferase system IIA component (Ntr-type)
MRLRNYLRAEHVLTQLDANDRDSALRALAGHLADAGLVPSGEEALAGLRAREELQPTVLGHGMALPHATLPGLDEPVLMVAVSEDPVPFGPEGEEPVRVFFTLLSPPNREGEHIKLLARICRLIRHENFVEELEGAPSPAAALALIRSVDEAHV